MLSKKEYRFLLIGSIVLGILMSIAIYIFMFAALILAFGIIVLVFLFLHDLFTTREKTTLYAKYLFLCLLPFFIFFSTEAIHFKYLRIKREEAISAIYSYKKLNNHFPSSNVSAGIDTIRFQYFPDSSLMHFTMHYFDRYGMPMEYSSKDNIWKLW